MFIRDLEALKEKDITPLEAEGIRLSAQASAEGAVLLENNHTLPICPGPVALYGFGARQIINGGIGSGDVVCRYIVNIEQGLENSGFTITTKAWLNEFDGIYREHRRQLHQILKEESDRTGIDRLHCLYSKPHEHIPCQPITMKEDSADTAIYVLSRKEGEGCDNVYARGGYLPTLWELEHLRVLRSRYKKLILLLNVGSVLDMQEIREIGMDAILLMYQGGNEIGNAVAKMLTGETPPSGRLVTTWARSYWDYPSSKVFGNNCHEKNVPYVEGIYVGYRYFDSFATEPLYPFGFGLSYTSFLREDTKMDVEANGEITIHASVRNVGGFRGKDVIQVYISCPEGRLDKPYQQLCAYGKTQMLEPGAQEMLELHFSMADVCTYDPVKESYILEAGNYIVRIGRHSRDTQICGVIHLTGECVIRHVKNLFPQSIEFEELHSDCTRWNESWQVCPDGNTPCYVLRPDELPILKNPIYSGIAPNYLGGSIEAEQVNLTPGETIELNVPQNISLPMVMRGEATMQQLIASMDVEELVHLVTGQLYKHPVYRMDSYSPHVLGACGETTNYFVQTGSTKEIPFCIFADGGGGLRLLRRFQTDEHGEIIYLDPVLNFENGELGIKDYREGLQDYYQYSTATPIPVQLACTWNSELLEKLGDVIGAEMERYGIDLWLAPSINLHRNPLGGRNFEYFSEDPYLSAMTAVPLILGVQKKRGRGTTVKHFAANNQETARTSHNACVTERTLRELYLKPFELTIKYGKPMCMMTSLNCLNGPHNANNKDLTTYLLLDEWNYDGLVTTDWNTTRKDRGSNTAQCIHAGTHLIMPGSNRDLNNLRNGLQNKTGQGDTIFLGELQKSAMGYLRYLIKTAPEKWSLVSERE